MDSNKKDDFLSLSGSKDAVQGSESENVASGPRCCPSRKGRKGRSQRSQERAVGRGTRSTPLPSAADSSGENWAAEAVGPRKEDSKSLSLDTLQVCGKKNLDTVSHDSECKSAARKHFPSEPSPIIHDKREAVKAKDALNLSIQLPDASKIKQKRNSSKRKAKHLKEETFTSLKNRTAKRSLTLHSNKKNAEECEKAHAEEESTSHLLTTPFEEKAKPPQERKKVQMSSLLSPASLKCSCAGFQCTHCSKAFKNEGALARHLSVHRTKQFACSDCEVVCKTGSLLWTHRQRAHIRKFECAECHKKYGMAYQLDRHIMRIHTGEKPHKCGECAKGFVSQQELRDHMECHNVDKPYLCHECGASFKRRDGLLHHVRRQHRPPQLSCELCAKSFKSPCSLRSHLEYHRNTDEGLAPYKCDICGNRYKTQKTLQGHLNRHKREANFQCHICGKAFKFKHHLVRHEMVHLDKKPFSCPECKQGFTQRSNMLVHMRKHTGERPYTCDICNKTFCQNISLKSHKQKKHGIDGIRDNVTSKSNVQHADSQTAQVNGHEEKVMIDINPDTPEEISCPVDQRATKLSNPIHKKERLVCSPEHLGDNHIVLGNQGQDTELHLLLASSPQQPSPQTRPPNVLNEQEDGEIQPPLSTRGEQTQEAFQDHQMEEGDTLKELLTQHDQPHGLQQQQEQQLHSEQGMQSIHNTQMEQSKSGNTSGLDTVDRRPIGQGSITTSTLYSHYRLSSKLPGGQSSLSCPLTNATTALSSQSPVGQSLSSQPQGSNPSFTLHHLSKVHQHLQALLEMNTGKSLGGALSFVAPSAAFPPFPQPPPSITQQPIMSPAVVSRMPRMLAPSSTASPSFQPALPLNDHPPLKSAGKCEGHLPPSLLNQSLSLPALCSQGVKPPSALGIIPPVLPPSQSVGAYNGNAPDLPQDSLIPFPMLPPVPHQSAIEGATPLQSREEGARSLIDNLSADSNNRQAALALASLHLPVGMGTQLQGATPYVVYPNVPNQYQRPMETGTHPDNNEFTG